MFKGGIMDFKRVREQIKKGIEVYKLDPVAYEELHLVCREYAKVDKDEAHEWNHELQGMIKPLLRECAMKQMFDEAQRFDDLLYQVLLFGARDYFDDYMQAVEYGKPVDKQFYRPRRHYLKRYVDAYQEIIDGKLDFLSISMPKRCGKIS